MWRRHCDRATADRLAILAAIDALGEAILEQTRLILGRNVQGGFHQMLDELEKDGEITLASSALPLAAPPKC